LRYFRPVIGLERRHPRALANIRSDESCRATPCQRGDENIVGANPRTRFLKARANVESKEPESRSIRKSIPAPFDSMRAPGFDRAGVGNLAPALSDGPPTTRQDIH
jgi:hypothetical protein